MVANGVDRSGAAGGAGAGLSPVDETIIDAKGDLIVGDAADSATRLAVGANDTMLMADSAQTTGLKWATPDQVVQATINGATAETAPAVGDLIGISDVSVPAGRKMTLENALKVINVLTEDLAPAKTADYVPTYDASATGAKRVKLSQLPLPRMSISGLIQANNVGDATNDIDISAGEARDATDVHNLLLAASITKQSDVVWAVGTNQGGLDTGAVGNSDYYIWLIKRSDTGVVDVLFSLSSTAPTMPTSYDFKRLIGWFKRVGGTIVAFTTYETEGGGVEFNWTSPTLDINLVSTLTTARRTDAVKVPLNFSVIAHLNIVISDSAGGKSWVYCPDHADLAPSDTVAPLHNHAQQTVAISAGIGIKIRTSAAGLIAARSNVVTQDLYAVVTLGFTWARRN